MNIWMEWALTSSLLILAVVLLRAAVGKRVGAGLRCALWALVLIRLLVPVQMFAVPVPEPVSGAPIGAQTEQTGVTVPAPSQGGESVGNGQGRPDGTHAVTPAAPGASGVVSGGTPGAVPGDVPGDVPGGEAPDLGAVLGWLWLGGAIASGLILTVFNLRFALSIRHRRSALACKGRPLPVYTLAGLSSPCLFGVLRPAVYVDPETADDPVMLRHVLAHEETHFRHGDHVWSLLRCAALAVHWWNPLVWLAAALSRRDGELFCDEGALKRLGDGERKAYGSTLLALITARPAPTDLMSFATTMSGGKKALVERIERIARPVKQRAWLVVLTTVLALTAAACSFAYAVEKPAGTEDDPDPGIVEPSDPTDPSESTDPTEPNEPTEPTALGEQPPEERPTEGNLDPNAEHTIGEWINADKPLDNTKVYEYIYTGTKEGDEAAAEAALAMAEMFMEDLCDPDGGWTFRVTEYRNLRVGLRPTLELMEEGGLVGQDQKGVFFDYYMLEEEVGPDRWLVRIFVDWRYEGIIGGNFGFSHTEYYDRFDMWEGDFNDGCSDAVGFLLCRDGDTFTMQSRYHKWKEDRLKTGYDSK